MFPEGVWNKSPNLLILDLWNGMYRVAVEHNALIVPISVMEEDGVCYAIQNKPIDVCSLDLNEGKQLIRDSLATAKWEVLEYNGGHKSCLLKHKCGLEKPVSRFSTFKSAISVIS